MTHELAENYLAVKERIARLRLKYHGDDKLPRLVCVSKGQSTVRIRALCDLGQREFGENYLQELEAKSAELRDLPISWIYIGRPQSNKISRIVKIAAEVQTIASEKQAALVARAAQTWNKIPYPVWIAVNADKEAQKGGIDIDQVATLSTHIVKKLPELQLCGIMAIPPARYTDAACGANVPELYRTLADPARTIGQGLLSLGMSQDLEIAIAAGSTCLRVGTGIFGPRSLQEVKNCR